VDKAAAFEKKSTSQRNFDYQKVIKIQRVKRGTWTLYP